VPKLSRERAERIAKGHACPRCKEYSYRKLTVKPAPKAIADELGAVWVVTRICGVCEHHEELGIADDGDIVYSS
jgi:hypothetical protein